MHMLQSFILSDSCSKFFGRHYRPSSGAQATVTTASGNRYTNQFQLFHDSSREQYGVTVTRCCSYSCFVLLKMGDSDARNM